MPRQITIKLKFLIDKLVNRSNLPVLKQFAIKLDLLIKKLIRR